MAETADDIPNDLVMASFEIVEGEYDEQFDRDGEICAENTRVWRVFDGMCERFAAGYQPKGATEFVRDLVARLTGEQGNTMITGGVTEGGISQRLQQPVRFRTIQVYPKDLPRCWW